MFREDFEFNDGAGPSHLASHSGKSLNGSEDNTNEHPQDLKNQDLVWEKDAELELKKIPFFVRGKARRNTENFAKEKGVNSISRETLYEAKAHYAR